MDARFAIIIGGWGYGWALLMAFGAYSTWGIDWRHQVLSIFAVALGAFTTWALWDMRS